MPTKKSPAHLLTCSLLLASMTANANLIVNGSFETTILPPDACSGSPPAPCTGTFQDYSSGETFDGWTVVGSGTTTLVSNGFAQLGYSFPAQQGAQWMDMSGFAANDPVGIQQQVSTRIGSTYDLSFWIGNIVGSVSGITSTIEVFLDGTSIGLFQNSDGSAAIPFTDWRQYSVSFQASNTLSTIAFFNRDSANDNMNGLDNISLSQGDTGGQAPEPVTLALLLSGLIGLRFVKRSQV